MQRETPQLCLGQLKDEAFSEEAWLVPLSSPPSRSFWRGSNALLIYHSSGLSVWSSSDDPHLAPAVLRPPRPVMWVHSSSLRLLALGFSAAGSVSLCLLSRLTFSPTMFTLPPFWVRWCKCVSAANSKISEPELFPDCPCLLYSTAFTYLSFLYTIVYTAWICCAFSLHINAAEV